MKKIVALVMALMMLICTFAAIAETPEGYPEVRTDIDLGGKEIWILTTGGSEEGTPRKEDPTEEEQLKYDYRDWLAEQFNCKFIEAKGGKWSTISKNMMEYVANPDYSRYNIYMIPSAFVMSVVNNNYCAGWDVSCFDYDNGCFNIAADKFLTVNGVHYASANPPSSPNGVIFFNKRLLEEAGIDWNTIYDMQAEGTWTWAAWEDMLAKCTRDIDNDGVIDVYGVGGDYRELVQLAPHLNGGKFFDFDENGKMCVYGGSDEVLEALNWADKIVDTYYYDDVDRALFQKVDAFVEGKYTFGMFEAWNGFSLGSNLAVMEDEYGAVAFPLPNGGTDYLNAYSDDYWVLPNCYTAEEYATLSYIFSLYQGPIPGIDPFTSWIGDKYLATDERAIDETYAMLRDPAHGFYEMALYMEGTDEMIDDYISWDIGWHGETPAQCIESAMPDWQAACDAYNATHGF